MHSSKGVFVIAEAGVNHNGSLDLALELVNAAAAAGADAVKFQTFKAAALAATDAPKAGYQKETTGGGESQLDMLRRLELDVEAHHILIERCRDRGITFLSSPFDPQSIELLSSLGLKTFKIPSGEITNLPYLRRVGSLGVEVILSTGMAEMEEIREALDVLETAGTPRDRIVVLHCTTEYPAPMEEVNLRAMKTLAETFRVRVGYSDHTPGIEIPIAAVALGATMVEKHFTLDRTLPGPDHRASLEPHELVAMVAGIRNVERALGDGIKRPTPSELRNRPIARKSIVAAKIIQQGELFSEENLAVKRPGTGLSPMLWDRVIGSPATRDYASEEAIELP